VVAGTGFLDFLGFAFTLGPMGRKPPNPLDPLFAPKKKQPPPLTVRLPPQMLNELTEIAKDVGKPRNAVLVAFLRSGMDTYYESQGMKGKRGRK
jgi:hypothetical protein